MTKRNWKGKTNTVVALLMGTSLLFGGQAYAGAEGAHKHHSQHDFWLQMMQEQKNQTIQGNDDNNQVTADDQHYGDQGQQAWDNQNLSNADTATYGDRAAIYRGEATPGEKIDTSAYTFNQFAPNNYLFAAKNQNSTINSDQQSYTNNTSTLSAPVKKSASSSSLADQIIANGLAYKGVPYKFGSSKNTTSTFDCSSFTQRVFKEAGITLPRDSRQQSQVGKKVSKDQLQKGDLVFFRSYGSSSPRITHVAIYAGNNTLLHTYGKPGVTTTPFRGTSWEKRFEIARRVI
ncbi:C40 family peptidase [Brevibacillus ruminantium]|uniref:C40 family peptidase n=1 Tax=Brevibacillus ruminantium TaxID=2950604 RepID=A0ABY4W7Z6_9BACL|nr:C40 family peptidase [Brevibacillus ruminantium]USG63306.1 C40 family peptidase [Brevibacillus ruminantium]